MFLLRLVNGMFLLRLRLVSFTLQLRAPAPGGEFYDLLRLRVVNVYTLSPGGEFYALSPGHRTVNSTLLLRAPAPGCDSYALVSGDDFLRSCTGSGW